MSLESNKIFAAVLSSALLIMVISIVAESVFHVEHKKPAFSIEVASEEAGEEEVVEGPSLAELLQTADPSKGERQFAKCKSCHTVEKGGADGTGPHLYGVIGREIGHVAGFNYSGALAGAGGTWTYEKLDEWLASPKNTFPGTSMAFAGIRKEDQRADLIAYLRTFHDDAPALPEVVAEDAAAEPAAEEAAEAVEGAAEETQE
ncbi:c-type cytochrome [Kordiimonas gwangyangensis]|uniref:c-type cytochrome n=1 Tax=Kordiimonas gwangyangensis TaxID=288022 RepID=UPI000370B856|nr:cytochrome c family protein [Kordiimonas gwangyangensis]